MSMYDWCQDELVTKDIKIDQLERDYSILKSQVLEAISILDTGTDYEIAHVSAILHNGLKRMKDHECYT